MINETMFKIVDRREFAKSVNFGTYPVISIDASEKDKAGRCASYHVPVRVEMKHMDGSLHNYNCEFCVFPSSDYGDGKSHCTVMDYGCGISASFGYRDAMECVKYANAPILRRDGWAVVVVHNSMTRKVKVFRVKFGRTIKNCMTAIMFADDSDSAFIAKTIFEMA